MSAIIHVMGRVTKDPAMQQGKNNGPEYISLDLASSQRSQNTQNGQNGYESMFYQCYFNKFLAERLIKAGVKSGTCIYVYGDLEIHPFLYQQGQKAGQPGVGAQKLMSRTGSFAFPTNRKMRIMEILEIIKMAMACLITATEVLQEVAVIKITLLRETST